MISITAYPLRRRYRRGWCDEAVVTGSSGRVAEGVQSMWGRGGGTERAELRYAVYPPRGIAWTTGVLPVIRGY